MVWKATDGFHVSQQSYLTLSLWCWKIFMRLLFVVVGHWRNIFNNENFPIYTYGIPFTSRQATLHTSYKLHSPKKNSISPKMNAILSLGNVTYFLDVTPSNQMPHPLSHLHPLYFMLFKFKDLVAKQQCNKTAVTQSTIFPEVYQTMDTEDFRTTRCTL